MLLSCFVDRHALSCPAVPCPALIGQLHPRGDDSDDGPAPPWAAAFALAARLGRPGGRARGRGRRIRRGHRLERERVAAARRGPVHLHLLVRGRARSPCQGRPVRVGEKEGASDPLGRFVTATRPSHRTSSHDTHTLYGTLLFAADCVP